VSGLIDCVLIGTSLEKRLKVLKDTAKSLSINSDRFNKMFLSIDDFGNGFDATPFEELGFEVLVHPRVGMVENKFVAMRLSRADWIFYCEDDVEVKQLPDLLELTRLSFDDRKCGMITLWPGSFGASQFHTQITKDLHTPSRYKDVEGDLVVFDVNENCRNHVYICFPTALFRKDIIEECYTYILKNYPVTQIETGYTRAWFDLGLNNKYFLGLLLKDPRGIDNLAYCHIHSKITDENLLIKLLKNGFVDGGHGFSLDYKGR